MSAAWTAGLFTWLPRRLGEGLPRGRENPAFKGAPPGSGLGPGRRYGRVMGGQRAQRLLPRTHAAHPAPLWNHLSPTLALRDVRPSPPTRPG